MASSPSSQVSNILPRVLGARWLKAQVGRNDATDFSRNRFVLNDKNIPNILFKE